MRVLDRSVYVGPSLYAHFPVIKTIEFVKGPDETAPVVVAVTIETP